MAAIIAASCTLMIRNDMVSSPVSRLIVFAIIGLIYHKKIIDSAKNLKTDFKKNIKPILIITILLIGLEFVISSILENCFHLMASNELTNRNILKENLLVLGLSTTLLTPLAEECIFRLPYHSANGKFAYIIYSTMFALVHVTFKTPADLLFMPAYFLLSFGIGYSYYKTNNILLSTIVHIINNALCIVLILF